jgi:hypothetical protein
MLDVRKHTGKLLDAHGTSVEYVALNQQITIVFEVREHGERLPLPFGLMAFAGSNRE